MSRVFVSCSYRDRAVGDRLGSLVRSLGHDSVDDQDDTQGTAWWNEVVGRIEGSDVFVAVASPAYAEAHACRLAAKHAAATGLPVVRVDLDEKAVPGCHPAVAAAVGVPFAPEDPEAVVRLAYALTGSPPEAPPEVSNGTTAPVPAPPAPPQRDPAAQSDPPEPDGSSPKGIGSLEFGTAVVTLLSAAGLVYIGLSIFGSSEPVTKPKPEVPKVTASATAEAGPSGTPTSGNGEPTTDAAVAALLAGLADVDSPRLPVSSCHAGADAVTCSNPAPNIGTVVLTPYKSPTELYAAYSAKVESVSGEPMTENSGNCSNYESEGEVGWNLDKGHTLDFSVAQQEDGGLDPASESAGRVFCTDTQQVMTLVWTQDPGLLVTVTGQPSQLVVTWWGDVHLQLACGSGLVGSGCAES